MWSSEVPNVSDVTWQNKLEWLERCYNTRTLYTHERWKKFTQMKKKSHNKQHLRTVLLDPIMGWVSFCGAVYYALHGGSNFWVYGWNPKVWPFKWKLLSSTFLWCCLLRCTRWFLLLSLWMKSLSVTIQIKATSEQYFPVVLFVMLYNVVLTLESVDEILKCDRSNESYWAVLAYGSACYSVQGGSNFWDHFFGPSISLIVLKVANKFLKMKMWLSQL